MGSRRFVSVGVLLFLVVLTVGRPAARPADWPPITAAEKALTDCAQQPGAPAVYLYREEIANSDEDGTAYYRRLKVLTPAGKERANIEIPVGGHYKIIDLMARVVRPDGGSREFSGPVFDKTALRARGFKVTLKTFALPDVDVGCIIDYRYKIVPTSDRSASEDNPEDVLASLGLTGDAPREGGIDKYTGVLSLPAETWDIQEDLFTYKARFSYKPSHDLAYLFGMFGMRMRLNWVTHQLPGPPPVMKKGRVELEVENIPAFEAEEFMTPESTERMQVKFFCMENRVVSPDDYWKQECKNWQKGAEDFVGKPGDVALENQKLVHEVSDPTDQLKALYERAQKIQNLSYDKTMTKQRRKDLKIKDNGNASDVLKHNYGWRSDITRTFVALARAAGFEARVLRVAMRDDKFFNRNLCGLYSQFDSELALVKVRGKERLFDPATPFCPFGLVRWSCTETTGIGPSETPPSFLSTPAYPPDTALTEREIALQLDLEGNLTGTANIRFRGQEALLRRLEHIHDDDVAVKKDLEKEMSGILPTGSTVSLKKVENMANTADNLLVFFEIAIPGAATAAGQRTLLPASPLLGSGQHPFRHAQRKYPVYFPFPRREFDDIVVTLPAGLKVETTPAPCKNPQEFFDYSLVCVVEGGSKIHIQRDLVVKKSYFPVAQYAAVKSFFDRVRAGDEEQIVLLLEKKEPGRSWPRASDRSRRPRMSSGASFRTS